MQFALHPWGVQHVLVCALHSWAPEHPHWMVCPQLSTRVTPQAPPHASAGVQQEFW